MPNLNKYNSREEEIKDHKEHYRSFGSAKGKFSLNSPDTYRVQKIIDEVPIGSIVLDIGCNDGSMGELLYKQREASVVFGVDVVAELVSCARQRAVIAEVGNAENLEYHSKMMDVVIMAEVMEHLYDPNDALAEICRVLKKKGIFLGSVPHDKGGLGIGKKADYHNWVFTKDELKLLLDKYFKKVEITETPYIESVCEENNVEEGSFQWYNWVCKGVK